MTETQDTKPRQVQVNMASSLRDYLAPIVRSLWSVPVALLTLIGLLQAALPDEKAAFVEIPPWSYWTLWGVILVAAPFRAFLKERAKASRLERICRQVFEETFVFLNYDRESRRSVSKVAEEGKALMEEISSEISAGNFSRAGMVVPLFHALKNPILAHYGSGTFKEFNKTAQSAVRTVLGKGYPPSPLTEHLRDVPWEQFWDRLRTKRPG